MKKPEILGYYDQTGYQIFKGEEEVYRAGNSPHDSTVTGPVSEGLSLRKIRSCCIKTAKDIAKEQKGEYIGVDRLVEPYPDNDD